MNILHVNGRNDYVTDDFIGGGVDGFIDRRKNYNILLVILAGYKPYLYDDVFARVRAFVPANIDVCVLSSGLFDEKLDFIAKSNNWSYLFTARNSLTQIQNIAIILHDKAKFIFKMDEDIFVTRHSFVTVWEGFQKAAQDQKYDVGFAAPLIPLNGYGFVRILEKLGMVGMYEKLFEKVKYMEVANGKIGLSSEAAKFFWGEGGYIPSIDYMDEEFHRDKLTYSVCPIRFNIGFILYHRNLWDFMGGWEVPPDVNGMGTDEEQLITLCVKLSLGMIVVENTVVGHLSFRLQNEAMREYYKTHRDKFRCPV